jgi:uncharacterized peroxidase-related enzyme
MAHISLPEGAAGILGPMLAYTATAWHLNGLTQTLLRGASSLTPAEREVIATYVSSANDCFFCKSAHAATARNLLGPDSTIVDQVTTDFREAPISDKLKALLVIAGKVQQGGRRVSEEEVARAREQGADDKAIHDTVLIAAAFCMFNRYVNGLATWAPRDAAVYERIGEELASKGYVNGVCQDESDVILCP